MHYSLDWLWAIRDLHDGGDEQVGDIDQPNKINKVDYEAVQRVLEMRPDLVDGWAKRVSTPLNSFDLFMLALYRRPLPENVNNAICETGKQIHIPTWLSPEKVINVQERHSALLRVHSVDMSKASFEDFTTIPDRVEYLSYLLDSGNGQVELGMFLGKGLISKDDSLNNLAMHYLELAIRHHERFPQVIDHIYTAITAVDPERCQANSERLIGAIQKVPTFAQTMAESLMEKIQDTHLVNCSEESSFGLTASDFSLKLTRYLPTWLTVLGNCLMESAGKANFYQHIDLLLTLPICYHDDFELACSWFRSLLNVFSVASDNPVAVNNCIERLSQLVDLEGRIESGRKVNSCDESVVDLVKQIVGEQLSPSPITYYDVPSDGICPLSPVILSLLSDDLITQPVEDTNGNDGKDKQVSGKDCKRNEMATLRLITLMEDWLRVGLYFDPSALQALAKHKYYQSFALKLCFQYEKRFGVLPFNVECATDSKEVRVQLLRLLSLDSLAEIVKVLNDIDESQLKGNQDIFIKLLIKYPTIIKDMVTRYSKSVWSFKSCCIALTSVDTFDSLPDTLSLLASAKAVIDVCVDKRESSEYQVILLKSMKAFLQNFEEKCLESLNANFSLHTDNVLAVLKALQSCTRPIQSLCSSAKSTNPDLSAHVPVLKKTLESVLFKVKIVLKENNCLSAFWMGNLKDRQ